MTIEPLTSGLKLKALREEAGLSVRKMATFIDMNFGTLQSRETRSKKPYLEYDLAKKVIPVLAEHGIKPARVLALVAGSDAGFYSVTPRSVVQRRLGEAMDKRRITARRLSLKAGLNQTAVRDILEGRIASPRLTTIEALSRVLGIEPAWLAGWSNVSE